jgi:hypothetical protein
MTKTLEWPDRPFIDKNYFSWVDENNTRKTDQTKKIPCSQFGEFGKIYISEIFSHQFLKIEG